MRARMPKSRLGWVRAVALLVAVALLAGAAWLSFAPKNGDKSTAADPLARGLYFLSRDQYTETDAALTAAVVADPANMRGRVRLGEVKVRRARYDEAGGLLAQVRRELMYDHSLLAPTGSGCDASIVADVAPPAAATPDKAARANLLIDTLLWEGRAARDPKQADSLWRCGLALAAVHKEPLMGARIGAAMGDAALARGDYDGAGRLYAAALAATGDAKNLPPDERQRLLCNAGIVRLRDGKRDDAIRLWSEARGIEAALSEPDDPAFRPLAARLDLLRGRLSPALDALQANVTEAGESARLGYVYTLLGQWDLAAFALRGAEIGDSPAYLAYAVCHSAQPACLTDAPPDPTPFAIGDSEKQAEMVLRDALRRDPANRLTRKYLGQLLIERAERRVVAEPVPGAALPTKAIGWLNEAEVLYTTLARDTPTSAAPQLDLARVATARRDYVRASEILQKATNLSAPGVNVWAELAAFYTEGRAPTDCSLAQNAALSAITRLPDDVRSWNAAGWTAYSCARYDEARTTLRRAIALRPNSADLRYRLALVLDRLGDAAGAERALTLADDIDPAAQYRRNLPTNYGQHRR